MQTASAEITHQNSDIISLVSMLVIG